SERTCPSDAQRQIRNDLADSIERLAHTYGDYRWESLGQRFKQSGLFVVCAATGIDQSGDMPVRRIPEAGGRENHDEVDAETLPVDRAQVGDRCGEIATENIDCDVVADFEAKSVGDAVL